MILETFHDRIGKAREKEQSDATLLHQKFHCVVSLFGQAQLPEHIREWLRKHPEHIFLRWLPDLLVISPPLYLMQNIKWMWLIDSKAGRQDTIYWTLEKAAHTAHHLQQEALGLPILYIWPDGCSCSYIDDLPDEVLKEGPPMRSGSGTPYWLVPKELTRSLEDVFGHVKDVA